MAGAIVNLTMLFGQLAKNAGDAADGMEKASGSTRRGGFGAKGRTSFEEWAGEAEEVTTEIRDLLAELRGGRDVGSLVPNQRDLIEDIQGTPFGKYLDKFAELYLEKLSAGFGIDPARARVIQEALYAQNIGARDIIKRLAGSAGKKFNFAQFEQDLKELFAAQQGVKRATDGMNRARKGSSSGALGRPKSQSCGESSSLDMLLKSGALR
jgi:hypothetical protein